MFKNNFPYQNRLAQSGHWFDWSKVWPQVHRILRHGGTAAFWVYLLSMPFESNLLKYLSFFKGLCRISTLKSSYFDTFDHGICTRKQRTYKPWSSFSTAWKNHIRTPPYRCSGTFIDLERWRTREATQRLFLR